LQPDDLMSIIKGRRSTRKFLPTPVPHDLVIKLIEAASWAPSGSNQQPWHFIAVEDRTVINGMVEIIETKLADIAAQIGSTKAREELNNYIPFFTVFSHAPMALCVFSQPYDALIARLLARYGKDNSNFQSTGHIQSCSAAMENLLLMAHALGLGGCWMTGPNIAAKEIGQLLGCDPGLELIAITPLGYPDCEPNAPTRPEPETLVRFI
jgi:nitroreductase